MQKTVISKLRTAKTGIPKAATAATLIAMFWF
jgi:hypothetical protein